MFGVILKGQIYIYTSSKVLIVDKKIVVYGGGFTDIEYFGVKLVSSKMSQNIFLGQWAVRLRRKFENNLTQKQKDPTYNVSPKETVPDNTGKGPSVPQITKCGIREDQSESLTRT